MENINNTIKGVKDLKYKLKVAYEEAKKDPYFKELTNSINLSDDGVILSYLYNCKNKKSINDFCSDSGYTFDKFRNSNDGVVVYQKIKK